MDSKIQRLKIYIITSINDQKNEIDCTNEETNQNQNQGEEYVVVEPLLIVETIQQITGEDLLTNKLENDQYYYLNMFQNLIMIGKELEEINIVVNLNENNHEVL